MKLEVNVGPWDRIIRGVIGVILLFFAMWLFNILDLLYAIISAVAAVLLGGMLIFTSVFGYCWLYKILGWDTLSAAQHEARDKKQRKEQRKLEHGKKKK